MATKNNAKIKRFKEYEEGLAVIQEAVDKLNNMDLDSIQTQLFSSEDYIRYYTYPLAVYNLTTAHPLGEFSQELYDKYKEIFEEHINSKVLPSLRGKTDQDLLQELVKRWANYKIMTRWLLRFFNYINRYFIPIRRLPSLEETSFIAFHDLVYGEMNDQLRNAVIAMINQERSEKQIDQALVKNTVAIYVEMGIYSMKYYEQDFEQAMLQQSAAFYSEKASNWTKNDYMTMMEECLKHEKEIVSSYLQATTLEKLLQVVNHELLNAFEVKKRLDDDL